MPRSPNGRGTRFALTRKGADFRAVPYYDPWLIRRDRRETVLPDMSCRLSRFQKAIRKSSANDSALTGFMRSSRRTAMTTSK